MPTSPTSCARSVTGRPFAVPDTPRNEDIHYDPRTGIQVESGGWFADFPLPSNFYESLLRQATPIRSATATRTWTGGPRRDRDAADRPGAALRAWTDIDRDVTDQAPLVPVTNSVNWWVTSERVGNYQSGKRDHRPLMSQLWLR